MSVRQGRLPLGVVIRTWFEDDNTWAYSLAVYVPSSSLAAAQMYESMQVGGPAKPADNADGEQRSSVVSPRGPIKPGPTGKIEPE